MGLTWGLRISQDSTDVIGDTSWHGPKMALHAVQVKPVCTNIFPCWRCVSQKNLTRIQIIPNASPVQLSILTPQNYVAILGTWGPRENRFTIPLKGPVILCAFGWNLPCLPCQVSQVTWSAWDPSGGVSYKCEISTNVNLEKKRQSIGIQREKSYMKKWLFFSAASKQELKPFMHNSWTPDRRSRGKRHFEKAVWRSTALDKERLSIYSNVTVIFQLDLDMNWDSKLLYPMDFEDFLWHFILRCSLARKLPIPFFCRVSTLLLRARCLLSCNKIEVSWIQQQ